MESNNFGCERSYIEQIRRITQQNMLIDIYCTQNFTFYNLVDFYYRAIAQNAILMFLIICAVYPVLFMYIAYIADNFLSVGMQDLSKRFNLSPTLSAVTLIAFANGSPDLLSALSTSGKEGGALISLGSLYGGFVSSLTLVIANVVWNSPGDLKLPKMAILKELGFYMISMVVIVIFGFRQSTGYVFIAVYMSIYACYIILSLVLEKTSTNDSEEDSDGFVSDMDEESHSRSGNFDKIHGDKPQNADPNQKTAEFEKPASTFESIMDQIVNKDTSMLNNLALLPLTVGGMLTVSHLKNPLMQSAAKYIVLALSVTWIILTMEIIDSDLHINLGYVLVIGLFFIVLNNINLSQNVLEIIYELVSVFAAIGWIKIISGFIIDFITFLAFYFNINEVILSSILLSAGNTVSDYFSNGALAKAGAPVMAGLACYSGQIFNNYVAFSTSIFGGINISTDFDIFGFGLPGDEKADAVSPMPIESKFMIIMMTSVIMLTLVQLIYLFKNNFVITTKFTYVLVSIYGVFFVSTMTFGFISRDM